MRLVTTIVISLLFISCGPAEGDIYENLLEEKRFKIEKIGPGNDLVKNYESINKVVSDSSDLSKKRLNQMELYRPVIFSDSDTSETCFAYEDSYRGMTIIMIEPLSKLDSKEYEKVN